MSDWSYAIAQHPMYLVIEEDVTCAERTPPWGAATIEAYIERWQRCLEALDRHTELRLGFDTSAVELERLGTRRPDIVGRMRVLARQGRLAFYNGTWSQPHLQLFGAEANIRQIETGCAAYRRIVGCDVRVHMAQEADAHEQLPQLLRALGFRFALPPGFFSTMVFQEPHELVNLSSQGLRFVQGEEWSDWVGLDGSTIAMYLPQAGPFSEERELRAGLLRVPKIRPSFPDMVEIDEAWMKERRGGRFVILDEALEDRMREAPPRSRVRLWSDWSYVEGIRAEELGRANRRAESAALAAESIGALARLLVQRPIDALDDIWKTILTAQHHDAYCFCAPQLKDKAIGWLDGATRLASALASSAASTIAGAADTSGLPQGSPVVVFNSNPAPTTGIVSLEPPPGTGQRGIVVLDARGESVPAMLDDGRVYFQAECPGLGFRSYVMRETDSMPAVRAVASQVEIQGPGYSAVVGSDAAFRSLRIGGHELLASDQPGNLLRACSPDGSELERGSDSPATVVSGPLAQVLRTAGRLGPRVRTRTEIWFYRFLPRIDVRLFLTFDHAAIGDFFDDDSKLNVYWPLGFDGEIHHDIAFGAVKTRPGRPFFPVSWVDVSDGRRGFSYFTKGTQRHRLIGRTLANVIAWGDDTDRIGNRADSNPRPWPKSFDQRLRGSHLIEYALYPHEGRWSEAGVVQAARSYGTPLPAVHTTRHGGRLPAELNTLSVGPDNVVVTAVLTAEDGLCLRLYESAGRRTTPAIWSGLLRLRGIAGLDGRPCKELDPFRIGRADLFSADASPR